MGLNGVNWIYLAQERALFNRARTFGFLKRQRNFLMRQENSQEGLSCTCDVVPPPLHRTRLTDTRLLFQMKCILIVGLGILLAIILILLVI